MKIKYSIIGLDCPNCAAKLAGRMEKREGIDSAKINFLTEKMTVESDLSAEKTFEIVSKNAKAFDEDLILSK